MPRLLAHLVRRPHIAGPEVHDTGARCPHWLRKLGTAGFVFFLVKGLLWLLAPALLLWFNTYF